ncbi:MAG: hypothetical protein MZV65_47585 [Chromatiales bacterium]|nr:hypothetical protein [Chromatiales bacterium]
MRDGALTSSALLSMGYTEEVREFIRWYAGYQFPDGKIPCCVDKRGADPLPEHDSHGEFIYTVMEYYRYTHDVGFLSELWPAVIKAVEYIDFLRRQRLTVAYRTPELRQYYGLMPESVSHEGYLAHPVHSYWDDFLTLRGLKDAAAMAMVLGEAEKAANFAALRDAFQQDLLESIRCTMEKHRIDYLPGAAELGDFDPTSTTIALIRAANRSLCRKRPYNRHSRIITPISGNAPRARSIGITTHPMRPGLSVPWCLGATPAGAGDPGFLSGRLAPGCLESMG